MNKSTIMKPLSIIFIVILLITACRHIDREQIIDYRFTPAHEETRTGMKKEWNVWAEDWYEVPYEYKVFVPDTYELMWEYEYDNGTKERKWKECTRFEYEEAKEELNS